MIESSLITGDCVEQMGKLPTDSVDLIITDPPYNLGRFMQNRDTNLAKMRDNFFGAAGWDDLDYETWKQKMDLFFKEAARVIKPGGSAIIFMAIINVGNVIKLAHDNDFYYKTTGIWHKLNPMPRNMNLHFVNSTESWVYLTYKKRTGTFNNDGKVVHDFIETSVTPNGERKYGKHPTQKPEQLIDHFIVLLSNKGDTVLDPFMGSGTTGVVCKRRGRNFIGIELDDNYCEFARKRIGDVKDAD